MTGLIIDGTKNFFTVFCDDGVFRKCNIKGKRLVLDTPFYNPLAPGDFVTIELDKKETKMGQILSLKERKNALLRRNPKSDSPQILATNVDYVFCVTSVDFPAFRPRYVDRVLVQCESLNLLAGIIVNKCDFQMSISMQNRIENWKKLGFKVFCISTITEEGLKDLANFVLQKKVVFCGESGVGKSSIINSLSENVQQKTGNLSEKYEKGVHTTTCGRLFFAKLHSKFFEGKSKEAVLIDTPGIRSFLLHDILPENLAFLFPEMKSLVTKCFFGSSCTHTHEKGCAILQALQEGKINGDRYESFLRIKEELKSKNY